MQSLCRTIRLNKSAVGVVISLRLTFNYGNKFVIHRQYRTLISHRPTISSRLSIDKPLIQHANYRPSLAKYFATEVIHVKSDEHCNHQRDSSFLEEKFTTTDITVTGAPSIKLVHRSNKGSRTEIPSRMSLEHGKAIWHLHNLFYLLSENYKSNEDNNECERNVDRFNVLTEFQSKNDIWYCTTTLFHPFKQSFQGTGEQTRKAENEASYNALVWLKEQGNVRIGFFFFSFISV